MDFELSSEQKALRDAARMFLADHWDPDRMRSFLDNPPAVMPLAMWDEIASMGWPGIAISERCGGGGADLVTAAIVAEEAGRALLPGPLHQSIAAGLLCEEMGCDHLAREIADGRVLVLATDEPDVRPSTLDGNRLYAEKIFVPDVEIADAFLVVSGSSVVVVPRDSEGVTITSMQRLDGLSRSRVVFEGVDVAEGPYVDVAEAIAKAQLVLTFLSAADLLGVLCRLLEMTSDYARTRIQFGRPIGTFQAVSHPLANMAVDAEIGRSLVYGAGLALDTNGEKALVSAAKVWLSEAAVKAGETAIQLHGGIGYTWELDVHLYLRRARCEAVSMGTTRHHLNFIAASGRQDD